MRQAMNGAALLVIGIALGLNGCGDAPEPPAASTGGTPTGSASAIAPPTEPAPTPDDDTDSDSDGLSDAFEAEIGTDPILADTDGDGFDDASEYTANSARDNPYYRNPRIADVPRLDVKFLGAPRIYITHTTSSGESRSFDNSRSSESSDSFTTGSTSGESAREETSSTLSAQVSGEISADPSIGASVGTSETETFGYEQSLSWSESQTRENRKTISSSESYSASADRSESGGRVEVTVTLYNDSDVAYELKNLHLSIQKYDVATGRRFDIGQLTAQTDNRFFPMTTLKPGDKLGPLVFAQASLELDQAYALLREGEMIVRVAYYDLADQFGESFNHRFNQIGDRTARVMIDFGDGRPPEHHLVAARGPDGGGIDFPTLMKDVLELDYETGTALWKFDKGVGKTRPGLTRIRNVKTSSAAGGYWIVTQSFKTGTDSFVRRRNHPIPGGLDGSENTVATDDEVEPLDLDVMRIRPGHVIRMIYIQDGDRDGLGDRTEALIGTRPDVFDTDGDGLGDGEELAQARNPLVGLAVADVADVIGDDQRLRLLLSVRNGEAARVTGVRINFGDGSDPVETPVNVPGLVEIDHPYAQYGEYPIDITAITDPADHGSHRTVRVRLAPSLVRKWSVEPTVDGRPQIVNSIAPMPDGGVVVAGAIASEEGSNINELAISRYTPDGELAWQNRIEAKAAATSLATDSRGNIYATDNALLYYLQPNGSVLWKLTPKLEGLKSVKPTGVVVDGGDRAYVTVTATIIATNKTQRHHIAMVDTRGNAQWMKPLPNDGISRPLLAPVDAGVVHIWDDKTDEGRRQRRYTRFTSAGEVAKETTFPVEVGTRSLGAAVTPNGRVLVVGGAGVANTGASPTPHTLNRIDTVVWGHDPDGSLTLLDPPTVPYMSMARDVLPTSRGFYTYEVTAPPLSDPPDSAEPPTEKEMAERIIGGPAHISIGAFDHNGNRLGRLRLLEGDSIVFFRMLQMIQPSRSLAPGPGGDFYAAGMGVRPDAEGKLGNNASLNGFIVRLAPNPQPTRILSEE